MTLIDTGLLIYAYRDDLPQHAVVRHWLETEMNGGRTFYLHPMVSAEFIRLMTRDIEAMKATPLELALDFLAAMHPVYIPPLPDDAAQLEVFRRLCTRVVGCTFEDCHCTWIAATAVRHRLRLASADERFARYQPELRWVNPLAHQ
jgi:predicted nucleic acid-binding protein